MNSEKDDAYVSWLDMAEKYDIFEIDESAEDSGSCRKDIIIDHSKIFQTEITGKMTARGEFFRYQTVTTA